MAGTAFSSTTLPRYARRWRRRSESGDFYVEFRVRHADGSLHWIAGKGQIARRTALRSELLRGAITKSPNASSSKRGLLAVNETLEARVAELREEARTLEVLNRHRRRRRGRT